MSLADLNTALSGIDIGTVDSVERIKHGLTNESWLVRAQRDTLVVRLSYASETSLQIDRRSEAAILDTVAAAGIAPDVIRCDPQQHVLITRYAGATWTGERISEPGGIDRVAGLLRQLHRLPIPAAAHEVDLTAVTQGYLNTLDQHGLQDSALTAVARKRALEIAGSLQRQSDPCLCHNDVHALNIVDDGTLRLIDWEYAGRGERLFDLASVCVYHRFARPQRERLLAGYAHARDNQAMHRLELACWLFDYVRDLWMAVRGLTKEA